MGLSDKQEQVLLAIERFLEREGYPPTVREIGAAVGLSSPASVHNHLNALEEHGCIRRTGAKRRALEVLGRNGARGEGAAARERTGNGAVRRMPLVGRVAAGTPVFAEENVEELVEVPQMLAREEGCFLLRVKGRSMVEAGILDGDLVVVRRQEDATNGDIVVALMDDEATLKRFFREEEYVRLQPENSEMEPIWSRDPRIIGKVVGLMRRVD